MDENTWVQVHRTSTIRKIGNYCRKIDDCFFFAITTAEFILGDPGTDSGGKGKSKRAEKYGTKKSKERREEPLGTIM